MLTYEKLYQEIKNKRKNKKNNIVQKGGAGRTQQFDQDKLFELYIMYIPSDKYILAKELKIRPIPS